MTDRVAGITPVDRREPHGMNCACANLNVRNGMGHATSMLVLASDGRSRTVGSVLTRRQECERRVASACPDHV